jgi:TonB family protein
MLSMLLLGLGLARAQEAPPADDPPPLLEAPALVDFVQAPYPAEAEEQRIEGTVLLLIELDETGAVTGVEVLEGAGYGFDEAAVEAARQFRFSPAVDETGPVPVAIEFEYGFVLDANTVDEAVPEEAPEAPVNLAGTLVEMGTRSPLAEQTVELRLADGSTTATTTDAAGAWEFRGVPPGAATLRFVAPSYDVAEQTVEVVEGQRTDLRLWARNQSYRANEIVGVYRKKSADMTRRTLTMDEVRRVPGTFGDPVRVIQNLPGAARSPLGTGLLVIRGANPEDSGVYVDGIRIPIIYHLGGYSSVINADLIESVDYLPGSYGVEYGRTMGGAIDVKTKTTFPERARFVWDTDALDTGLFYEGRAGRERKLGVAVAARRSYVDAIIPIVTPFPEITVRPRWYDYQLKIADLSGGPGSWSAFVFGFEDKLVASTPPGFAQGTDPATQGDLGSVYSTHRAYVQWTRPLSESLSIRLLPSLGLDGVNFAVGNSFRVDQWQLLAEARAELIWEPSERLKTTAGLDFIGGTWGFTAGLPIDPGMLDDYDPLGERDPWTTEGTGTGWGPDLYADAVWRPVPDQPDRLMLRPGARLNVVALDDFSREGDPAMLRIAVVEPRLSARWAIVDTTSLKGAVGQYHQPPQPFEVWRPEGRVDLDFERALSVEVGVEQRFGDAIEADASVFAKKLDRLVVQNADYVDLDSQFFTNEGIGRIRGAELIVRHRLVDRFFGWVSYTLSQSERNDTPTRPVERNIAGEPVSGPGAWYPFQFDQTHILVAVAGQRLPRDWEVSARVQYVTGNPTTPYQGGVYDVDQQFYVPYSAGSTNSARLPDFLAVDARIDKLFTFKTWQLEVYLDLLNAIRGENPEFVLDNYDYTQQRYIRGLPFIPSPGFRAEFAL